jgi:polyvinyl alcohol dehydrogenase (cytochrome)
MMAVALTISRAERIAVASHLGTIEPVASPVPAAFCAHRSVRLRNAPATSWIGWSPASTNARFQPASQARLTVDQVRTLRLKWAFGFAGDTTAFAPPTVTDGQMFVGSAGGVVHAMRADSGCLQWTFQANGPVRTAIVIAPHGPGHALLFGDMTGWFYAVAAETGRLVWKVQIDTHDSTRLTAAPIADGGVVYVPVSSWEETRASDLDYACCTFRGDGRQVWRTFMTDPPTEQGKTARGTPRFGPSGVAVWATPTLDPTRNLLYIASGDNYTEPATVTSDAVIALDRGTGRIVWVRQLTENDVYNGSCAAIPEGCGPDFDFGSSPILVRAPDGRELLLAGQKSGIVWALDPARRGEVVWQTRVGVGGLNGGVQWGMATDGRLVFARRLRREAVAQPQPDRHTSHGARSVRRRRAHRLACRRRRARVACRGYALPRGTPARVQSLAAWRPHANSWCRILDVDDGHLRAHASENGALLWAFDTMRDFDAVNGVRAWGGSIDGPGAVVVDGMVFISSGYTRNGGVAGNVLLAFAPE